MSANQQPVPPIVTDTVITPFIDPLPKFRVGAANVKKSTDAVLAAIRCQTRNAKRDRSPSAESTSTSSSATPSKIEVDCTTAVYAPLDSMAGMPFSMKTAKLHAEALAAVAKQLTDALEAEETERPKAIKRIDEWAAKSADGFDMANPAHAAALAWFKDNLAFERVLLECDEDGPRAFATHGSAYNVLVVTLASTIRIASYVQYQEDAGVSWRYCRVALAKKPPPYQGNFMGVHHVFPLWDALEVPANLYPNNASTTVAGDSDEEVHSGNSDRANLYPDNEALEEASHSGNSDRPSLDEPVSVEATHEDDSHSEVAARERERSSPRSEDPAETSGVPEEALDRSDIDPSNDHAAGEGSDVPDDDTVSASGSNGPDGASSTTERCAVADVTVASASDTNGSVDTAWCEEFQLQNALKTVKTLLPPACPLQTLPATAVLELFKVTTLLELFVDSSESSEL